MNIRIISSVLNAKECLRLTIVRLKNMKKPSKKIWGLISPVTNSKYMDYVEIGPAMALSSHKIEIDALYKRIESLE